MDYNEKMVAKIKDSGERQEFETGAVRDIQKGKGRCDLMPLEVLARLFNDGSGEDGILMDVGKFQKTNDTVWLYAAINRFSRVRYSECEEGQEVITMLLEVSKHFEEGAEKYEPDNWRKGIPVARYIDSAVRHYLKWMRGDRDEPHDRAFVWNLVCCVWEVDYSPRASRN